MEISTIKSWHFAVVSEWVSDKSHKCFFPSKSQDYAAYVQCWHMLEHLVRSFSRTIANPNTVMTSLVLSKSCSCSLRRPSNSAVFSRRHVTCIFRLPETLRIKQHGQSATLVYVVHHGVWSLWMILSNIVIPSMIQGTAKGPQGWQLLLLGRVFTGFPQNI